MDTVKFMNVGTTAQTLTDAWERKIFSGIVDPVTADLTSTSCGWTINSSQDLSNKESMKEAEIKRAASKTIIPVSARLLHVDDIKKVVFHDPATIVIWRDGSKTVVKCGKDDVYQKEVGLSMCIVKKLFGSRSAFKKAVKEWSNG